MWFEFPRDSFRFSSLCVFVLFVANLPVCIPGAVPPDPKMDHDPQEGLACFSERDAVGYEAVSLQQASERALGSNPGRASCFV